MSSGYVVTKFTYQIKHQRLICNSKYTGKSCHERRPLVLEWVYREVPLRPDSGGQYQQRREVSSFSMILKTLRKTNWTSYELYIRGKWEGVVGWRHVSLSNHIRNNLIGEKKKKFKLTFLVSFRSSKPISQCDLMRAVSMSLSRF